MEVSIEFMMSFGAFMIGAAILLIIPGVIGVFFGGPIGLYGVLFIGGLYHWTFGVVAVVVWAVLVCKCIAAGEPEPAVIVKKKKKKKKKKYA